MTTKMTDDKVRDELIKELHERFAIKADGKTRPLATFDHIATFILERDKKIVDPLVNWPFGEYSCESDAFIALRKSRDETLKNVGVKDA